MGCATGGHDDGCQVNARVTRRSCRYPWDGTGDLEPEVYVPTDNKTHLAQFEQVSSGDQLCLVVRNTGVQLRSC